MQILEFIESNGYRVYYHLRYFLGGVPIVDNMIHGVVSSKRTVCLLSKNFLRRYVISTWKENFIQCKARAFYKHQ